MSGQVPAAVIAYFHSVVSTTVKTISLIFVHMGGAGSAREPVTIALQEPHGSYPPDFVATKTVPRAYHVWEMGRST